MIDGVYFGDKGFCCPGGGIAILQGAGYLDLKETQHDPDRWHLRINGAIGPEERHRGEQRGGSPNMFIGHCHNGKTDVRKDLGMPPPERIPKA